MLISGRWMVLSFLLVLSGPLMAAAKRVPVNPGHDAAIAAEQQRAFNLSSSAPKLMPDDTWFDASDGGRNASLTDPMGRNRWARDPYSIQGHARRKK